MKEYFPCSAVLIGAGFNLMASACTSWRVPGASGPFLVALGAGPRKRASMTTGACDWPGVLIPTLCLCLGLNLSKPHALSLVLDLYL